MTPACTGLLEPRGSGLKLLKSTFNAENFICQLSWSISSHFSTFSLLKCMSQPKIAKNSLKPPTLGVQGHSKSSMLTFLRSSSPVLVMTSSMSVPICNHIHVRRANNGRITLFKGGVSLSPPQSWEPLLPSGMKFCHKILETLSYHMVKNKSLSLLGFDRY